MQIPCFIVRVFYWFWPHPSHHETKQLGQDDAGVFFLITLLSLELVWFGFLSYDWVLVLWLGSCLMVGFLSYEMGSCLMFGFLSYGWVFVLWLGSCLMLCVLVLWSGFLSYDMGSCLMIWVLVL